jgi:hypothetical protein
VSSDAYPGYALPMRARDAVAVLDALSIGRPHFLGSWCGPRLGYVLGEHAPKRAQAVAAGPQAEKTSPLPRLPRSPIVSAQERMRRDTRGRTKEETS